MSGNLTWAKADFKGKFTVFISTNNATTRVLTISDTGFVAGDFICLLINQNSSGSVSVTIGTRSIAVNRGNIINAIYDGTNWNLWSGGGVWNTSTSNRNKLSFGFRTTTGTSDNQLAIGDTASTLLTETICIGISSSVSGDYSSSVGNNNILSGRGSSAFANYNRDNDFQFSTLLGLSAIARRYGSMRHKYDNNITQTDSSNPSSNGEKIAFIGTTANATITEIFLRGVSPNICVLQAKNVIAFKGQAVAFRSDYTGSARWSIEGLIKRNSANVTTLIGVTATRTHSDGTGGTLVLTIDANDTNESLRVQVTGNASETWTWLVELELLDLRIA
jgi:hypothetical protein